MNLKWTNFDQQMIEFNLIKQDFDHSY